LPSPRVIALNGYISIDVSWGVLRLLFKDEGYLHLNSVL
jgi:hypothetical protein